MQAHPRHLLLTLRQSSNPTDLSSSGKPFLQSICTPARFYCPNLSFSHLCCSKHFALWSTLLLILTKYLTFGFLYWLPLTSSLGFINESWRLILSQRVPLQQGRRWAIWGPLSWSLSLWSLDLEGRWQGLWLEEVGIKRLWLCSK